ncbi:cytochrome c biogenesis CcdA family protein [Ilumatobacter sp.]|uniref:cytochrome c biogenesis CcdA family protein n=1 Tax=Ilumatobacter sp. TaxID=1967498 RepID=UPI003B52F627
MSLSFIRGLVAAVNPCGFILLPTYLMYFLGISTGAVGTQRATIRRALLVSAAVSAGFLSVFAVAGVVAYNFTSWINENAKYATVGIAAGLLALGIAMLLGYEPSFLTPSIDVGEKDRTIASMFVYGVAYAVASIGCTIGLFIATVFSSTARDGLVSGVANFVVYGAGMALLVSALTIAIAFANTSLLNLLRSSLAHVDRVAAAFVVLSSLYLFWYFYWVDLREEGDPITLWVEGRQAAIASFLDGNWPTVAIVILSVVVAAIGYVTSTRRRDVVAVAAVGVAVTVGVWATVGTEPWRVGLIAAAAVVGAALGAGAGRETSGPDVGDRARGSDPSPVASRPTPR